MNATITERVAAGAAFLDEHDPEWWRADVERAIDLDELNLQKTDRCVLGQRCPLEVLGEHLGVAADELAGLDFTAAYSAYSRRLSGLPGGYKLLDWADERGFTTEPDSWNDLTAEWKSLIEARRAA